MGNRMTDVSKRFDGHVDLAAVPSTEALRSVPAQRGVLALLGEGDQPLLLLTAANMRQRLLSRLAKPLEEQPRKRIDLRAITQRVLWKRTFSHFQTDLEYLETARWIWPKRYPELLAWKLAWLVHVDPAEAYPHFLCTRRWSGSGRTFGPFDRARSAERFIEALQDAFDLCRDIRCLRLAPNAPRCAYAQMGRCLSPCDGSLSMADYRQRVAQAADFAAGKRGDFIHQLTEKMQDAAGQLQFEKAAAQKKRLDRLKEFDRACYQYVRPIEEFCYLLFQRGPTAGTIQPFLACRGQIVAAAPMDTPPKPSLLNKLLKRMACLAAGSPATGQRETFRLGLVVHYLFSSPEKRGVIVPYHTNLSIEPLLEALASGATMLKLRGQKSAQVKRGQEASNETPS